MKLSDLDLDLRLPKPPMVLVSVLVIGMFVPMGVASAIWFKRNYFDPNPRIHIFHDMDHQAKSKAQSTSAVFKDGRSMQPYAPGTVAWGRTTGQSDPTMLKDDDLAYRGYAVSAETGETEFVADAQGNPQARYLDGYPDTVKVDAAFIRHGQTQYNIHCFTCHGADGRGVGPTKREMDRLAKVASTGTVPFVPANLTDQTRFAKGVYANGRIFNTISHGQGTMSALGHQIAVKDRWAIVAYVRAMQRAQVAPISAQE